MNLKNFATTHNLMNDTKFAWQLKSKLASKIPFQHKIH